MKTLLITAIAGLALSAGVLSTYAADEKTPDAPKTEETKTKAKPYPLKTCIVSGEELGGMGKPVVMEYKGQEIKFCCKSCKPKFEKDPEKYIRKMEEEVKKAKDAPKKEG